MGLRAELVPYTSPTALLPILHSQIAHVAVVAADLKLNAILTLTSADLKAQLAAAKAQADGDLAEKESSLHTLASAEAEAKLQEAQVSAAAAQDQSIFLAARLDDFYRSKIPPADDLFATIAGLAEKGGALAGAMVAAMAPGPTKAADVVAAVRAGVEVVKAIDKLDDVLPLYSCDADPICKGYRQELGQARQHATAANFALAAAGYAVQVQDAATALFEAKRAHSRDLETILRSDGIMIVEDPVKVARASKYLCEYGAYLQDEAARTLFEYQRAGALWDVPDAASDAAWYAGTGGSYAYPFNELLTTTCASSLCSLWGRLDAFRKKRLEMAVPGTPRTLFLGTDAPAAAAQLATWLRAAAPPGGRASVEFGLYGKGASAQFGARPSGTSEATTLGDGTSFSDKWAVQVLHVTVKGRSGAGVALRETFPFRLSRPDSDPYVNAAAGGVLGFVMAAKPYLERDGGRLLTYPSSAPGSYGFRIVNLDAPAAVVEHPESLAKPWTLWVPVCVAGELPSSTCATAAEVAGLGAVEVQVQVRYKSGGF